MEGPSRGGPTVTPTVVTVRISLIVNTADAGELEQLRGEVSRLRREGHVVLPRVTFEAGDARRFAAEAAADGWELVIAAGGDGTLNEAANGLHARLAAGGGEASRLPRLGIIPLGTGNDLAAALELPTEVPEAMRAAVSGRVVEVDVGMVGDRCFLNVSTGGFGAEATEEAPPEVKRALGPLAYVVTGVKKFVGLEPLEARFTAGDEVIADGRFLLFAVGNCRRTGGGNWLTPEADLTDGLLDLCLVREMSRVEFLRLLPDLRAGNHVDNPNVIYRQLPEITVDSEAELSVNADGEPLSGRRFAYRVSEHRLRVRVPRQGGGAA